MDTAATKLDIGGVPMRSLCMPDFTARAVPAANPGQASAKATRLLGGLLCDVMPLNAATPNFHIMGPNETASNRLQAMLEVTGRDWDAAKLPNEEHLSPDGWVMVGRFHPKAGAINRAPRLASSAACAQQAVRGKLVEHERCTGAHGIGMPEVHGWHWPSPPAG